MKKDFDRLGMRNSYSKVDHHFSYFFLKKLKQIMSFDGLLTGVFIKL